MRRRITDYGETGKGEASKHSIRLPVGAEYDDVGFMHWIEAWADRERRRQKGIVADLDQLAVGAVARSTLYPCMHIALPLVDGTAPAALANP
jgi:hypothetical protein